MPDMTMEEFEAGESKPVLPKAEELKLDAEGLPDEVKGKTAAEIANELAGLKKAFKASEEMRITMQSSLQSRNDAPPPPPPVKNEQPKWPTREEIAEMMKDPDRQLEAVEIMQRMALQNAGEILEKRFAPLTDGVVNAAKVNARAKFPLEFELFNKEIEEFY